MTVLPHNPHPYTHTDAKTHTRTHARSHTKERVGTHACALTSSRTAAARQSRDRHMIKISVVFLSYIPCRLLFSVRHKIVHSCFRLAPHLRRHIWDVEGGGGWSINQNTTINGLNHCSLVWPQRYYWQSTPLPLRGGGERFGAGKSAYIQHELLSGPSLGWISVKGWKRQTVCLCACWTVQTEGARRVEPLTSVTQHYEREVSTRPLTGKHCWAAITWHLLHLFTTECCSLAFTLHQLEPFQFAPPSRCR